MRHQQKNKEIAHPKKKDGPGGVGSGGKNGKEEDGIIRRKDGSVACCIPFLTCSRAGKTPLPESLEDGVKLSCTNPDCLYSQHLVHIECFLSLETNLMKLLTSQGYRYCRREGILLTREMLWEPKGIALLQKNLKCECGKGKMKRDDEAWAKRQALVEPPTEEKEKKKHKPVAPLPSLITTVKKGAPPPPNFHKLDSHYLSSHSPTRSAAYVEDKYGPSPAAPVSKTRTTSSNAKAPSCDTSFVRPSVVAPSPVIKKPPIIAPSKTAKKPTVPIGYAPVDFPELSGETTTFPPIKKPKVPIGYAPVESAFPKLVETKPVVSEVKRPEVKPKAPEPVQSWKVITNPVKSKPIESTVEKQLKNENVESKATNYTIESKPIEVLETSFKEPVVSIPSSSMNSKQYSFSEYNIPPKQKTLVSIEVQTDETSFDQTIPKNLPKKEECQNSYRPKDYDFDSDSNSVSPRPLARTLNFAGSGNDYVSSARKSRLTTSSGFASISDADFSPYQTTSPNTEEISSPPSAAAAAIVTFLFKSDETCAVEIYQNGRKEKLKNIFDNEWTPLFLSMVDRAPEVGEKAQIHYNQHPKHVVYDIFKCIGKPVNQIQKDPNWKFEFVENNGIKCFEVQTLNGKRAIPEDYVVAAFLKALKARAENHLDTVVNEVYLSSNFDFTESEKSVFRLAAKKLPGFEIVNFYVIDIQ